MVRQVKKNKTVPPKTKERKIVKKHNVRGQKPTKRPCANEEVSSDDMESESNHRAFDGESESEFEQDLTKHLSGNKQLSPSADEKEDTELSEDESSAAIGNEEAVTKNDEVLKLARLHRPVSERTRLDKNDKDLIKHKAHRLSPVCVCFSNCCRYIVSCSKDGTVVKYDLEKRARVPPVLRSSKKQKGNNHRSQVNCCAISPTDKFLATGGSDSFIKIWNFETLEFVTQFKDHRGPITSLTFRKSDTAIELITASTDRSLKIWNLDEMGIVNTLYGHYGPIQQIDMLSWPRIVSCGGQDRFILITKIFNDTHLVFNGLVDSMSIDTISLINEEHFISGSANGSVSIWSTARKKPVCTIRSAHDAHSDNNEPHWITAVCSLHYTDLVATGSSNGLLKLWRTSVDYKSLTLIDEYPIVGFINHISFSHDGQLIACAIGQEHKNGRWWRLKEAKNSVVVLRLQS